MQRVCDSQIATAAATPLKYSGHGDHGKKWEATTPFARRTPQPRPMDIEPNAYIRHILNAECNPDQRPAQQLAAHEQRKRRELQTYLSLAAKRLLC